MPFFIMCPNGVRLGYLISRYIPHGEGTIMMITLTTVQEIDSQVTKGLHIGSYGRDCCVDDIPRRLFDWNVRAIEDRRSPGTGYIIAVPSNTRTRVIYVNGRRTWLNGIGFCAEMAEMYIRAGQPVKLRWEHDVACFVFDNFAMDAYVLEKLLAAEQPRKVADKHGISTLLPKVKIVAGCQIIQNIRSRLQRVTPE